LNASQWRARVRPGSMVAMNIILRFNAGEDDTDSCQCPSCKHLCSYASLGDEVIWCVPHRILIECTRTTSYFHSPSCGTLFRVSHGVIAETEDTPGATGSSLLPPQLCQLQITIPRLCQANQKTLRYHLLTCPHLASHYCGRKLWIFDTFAE